MNFLKNALVTLIVPFSLAASPIDNMPEKVTAVGYMNINKMRQHPAFADLLENPSQQLKDLRYKIQNYAGVDITRVQKIWVGAVKKNQGLAIFEGSYDIQEISERIQEIPQINEAIGIDAPLALYLPDRKNKGVDNLLAFVDDKTMLVGQEDIINEYLAISHGDKKGFSNIKKNAIKPILESDIFIHGITTDMDQEMIKNKPQLKGIESAEFKIIMTTDIEMDLTMKIAKAEMLDGMFNMANFFIGMAKTKKEIQGKPLALEFMENIKVAKEKGSLKITSRINADLIREQIDKKIATN